MGDMPANMSGPLDLEFWIYLYVKKSYLTKRRDLYIDLLTVVLRMVAIPSLRIYRLVLQESYRR